jgi:hypothetical protein
MEGCLFGSHGGRLDIALAGDSTLSASGSRADSTEDTGPDPLIGTEIAGRYLVGCAAPPPAYGRGAELGRTQG